MTSSTLETPSGPLFGIVEGSGAERYCIPDRESPLVTRWGRLVPRFEDDPPRHPYVPPVSVFPDGGLKALVLAERTVIETAIGPIPVEQLTFHRDGSLRRVFPLSGKTNAYWSIEEEGQMCPVVSLKTPLGVIEARFISILFYPDGSLRSFALWPDDTISVNTPAGVIVCRNGVSFHPGGELRTVEPARPAVVPTPIGKVDAFDGAAIGIHGDSGSLEFAASGEVVAVKTETTTVKVVTADGDERVFGPQLIASMCSDEATEWQPMVIRFEADAVLFDDERIGTEGARFEAESKHAKGGVRLPMLCH